jgi:hypothetical protein
MAVLDILIDHPHPAVRRAIVINSHLSLQGLYRLVKDTDHETKARIAANWNALPTVLTELAKDGNWRIRAAVAKSPKTSKTTLVFLADDPVIAVRRAVARNRHSPVSIFEKMAVSDDLTLKRIVKRRRTGILFDQKKELISAAIKVVKDTGGDESTNDFLKTLADNFLDSNQHPLVNFFRSCELPQHASQALVEHADSRMRQLIAGHPKLSPAMQSSLASDDVVDVRCALAGNFGISEELINTLMRDPDKRVRRSLSVNYAVPYDIRQKLRERTIIRMLDACFDHADDDYISAELQIGVIILALAASWAIYFAIRWLVSAF